MQRIHLKCLCQLLQVSRAHLLNKQRPNKRRLGLNPILRQHGPFRSCTVETVFFPHSPMFLHNKHSNCTRNTGLGNLQDEGHQPLEPSRGPGHLARSVWVTGGSGLWWGHHRQGIASFSPCSHPSSCAQLTTHLRDSSEDGSLPLSCSCS